jgi:hypothetical protein
MFLYKDGITVEAADAREAEMYKKLGFVEVVEEPAPKPKSSKKPAEDAPLPEPTPEPAPVVPAEDAPATGGA